MVVPGVEGEFSYRVPEHLQAFARLGIRALVPFGRRRLTAFITAVSGDVDERATREIECLLDRTPIFSPMMMRFTRWMSHYYFCPWADALKAALPSGISLDEKKYWVLETVPDSEKWREYLRTHPVEQRIAEALKAGPLSAAVMKSRFGLSQRAAELHRLSDAGVVTFRPVLRPPRVKSHFDSIVMLTQRAKDQYGEELFTSLRSVHQQKLIRAIHEAGPEGILRSELLKGASSARRQAFGRLSQSGLIDVRVEEVSRWDPQAEQGPSIEEPEMLTPDQQSSLAEIRAAAERSEFAAFLLYGVTGSGKTQVYIEAIRRTLKLGRTALVLLPEIALTPFIWSRFHRAFGNRVAIQHSAQPPAVRFDLWRDILAGKYSVVIGARSAVFAPLKNLGIVIVDEEQEGSYKQEDPSPRYHARDAALKRAHMEKALVVLGSATPSLETWHHASSGRYRLLRLPERVGGVPLPKVEVVTWPSEEKVEPKPRKKAPDRAPPELPVFTDDLLSRIDAALKASKQVILLQNRRGYAPFIICRHCGSVPHCEVCSVSLTYHRKGQSLRCHYCGHSQDVPETCPRCGSQEIAACGLGTQRLEEELAVHFPGARLIRMDSDTVNRRGAHGRIVAAFARGEYDILLGTQMVARGMDFPDVALAAVVQADIELFHPDFRATERGAGLIIQLAGRSGRRADHGCVVIQTALPAHPLFEEIAGHDWSTVAGRELAAREAGGFPPFKRLILLRALGRDESAVARSMIRLRNLLESGEVELLGPAPAVVARVRGQYRYHLLARSDRKVDPSGSRLHDAVRKAIMEYTQTRTKSGVKLQVDVDPVSTI